MTSKQMGPLNLAEDQIKTLEDNFQKGKNPDGTSLMLIAAECGLTEDDTRRWFNHRYSQWRKSEGLPAEQGSVLDLH